MNIVLDLGQIMIGIGVLLNCYLSWKNTKKIETVHIATNSLKDALVASTAAESYARGLKHGTEGISKGEASSSSSED